MARRLAAALVALMAMGFSSARGLAVEKLKMGTSTRTSPHYALPMLAAEEKGFWKEQGLEVTWTPFASGGEHQRAFAAGAIQLGLTSPASVITSIARKVPIILVADTKYIQPWYLVVPTDSKIRTPQDLAGARVSISRTGSLSHVYGQVMAKALNLERKMQFLAMGGVPQQIAGLKAGAADALLSAFAIVANLLYAGEVRVVVDVSKYLPPGQGDAAIGVRKDFAQANPETLRKALRAVVKATDFIMKNRDWAVERMVNVSRFTPEAARGLAGMLKFASDVRISREEMVEVVDFLVAYKLLAKEDVPPLEELFTNRYVP